MLQDIPTHLFCSKRCKEQWQKDVLDVNLRKIVVWSVNISSGKYHFEKDTEYDYLSPIASKYSYFSKNLGVVDI
jgi:hypothetical protein